MLTQIYEVTSAQEAAAISEMGVDHIGVLVGDGALPRELPAARARAILAAAPPPAKRLVLSLSANFVEVVAAKLTT